MWPNFEITAAVLADLELTADGQSTPRLHLYRSLLGTWTKVQLGHVIPVEEHATIFLKSLNVSVCYDFDHHLEAASKLSQPLHFRHNLHRERSHVAAQLDHQLVLTSRMASKRKGKGLASKHLLSSPEALPSRKRLLPLHGFDALSPSTQFTVTPSPSNHRIKTEVHDSESDLQSRRPRQPLAKTEVQDPTSDFQSRRPRRQPPRQLTPTVISIDDTDSDTYLPTNPTTRHSPIIITSSSDSSSKKHVGQKTWPADYHAIDIVNCFVACDELDGKQVADIFYEHFGLPFRKTTFYDHRARWVAASQQAKDQAIKSGRTQAGLWSKFMASNPAVNAKKKAAKKRLTRQESTSVEEDSSA
jgi:hypothetical protein